MRANRRFWPPSNATVSNAAEVGKTVGNPDTAVLAATEPSAESDSELDGDEQRQSGEFEAKDVDSNGDSASLVAGTDDDEPAEQRSFVRSPTEERSVPHSNGEVTDAAGPSAAAGRRARRPNPRYAIVGDDADTTALSAVGGDDDTTADDDVVMEEMTVSEAGPFAAAGRSAPKPNPWYM